MTPDPRAVEAQEALTKAMAEARKHTTRGMDRLEFARNSIAALAPPWHLSDQPPAPLDAAWDIGPYLLREAIVEALRTPNVKRWNRNERAALTALAEHLEAETGS